MPGFDIDDSQWPLVRIEAKPKYSHDDWYDYQARFWAFTARGEWFWLLQDFRNVEPPKAGLRRYTADALAEHKQVAGQLIRGNALVMNSAILRGALTATGWLNPPPFPFKVFAEPPAAERWLQNKTGLVIPQ